MLGSGAGGAPRPPAHRPPAAPSLTCPSPPRSPPDELDDPQLCPQNLAVRWHTEVGAAVYATPLITDLFSDGRKDIVVPGLKHSLAVVEARDGARSPTFEGYHRSTLHTSPLMHDVDFDGVLDIVVATYDGQVKFFKDTVRGTQGSGWSGCTG